MTAKSPHTATIEELVSGNRSFLTCAGTETYLVFHQQLELPHFAAFTLYSQPEEQELDKLEKNHLHHIFKAAAGSDHGLLIDIQTWRASPDYLKLLGRDPGQEELEKIHRAAVIWTRGVIDRWRQQHGYSQKNFPVLLVADIGPRGDGYKTDNENITSDGFRDYHSHQLNAIKSVGGVDLVCAYTITSVEEAIGIAQASSDVGLPVVISVTVETDGKLPDGSEIRHLVEETDRRTELEERALPLFYMVNCAHPTHINPAFEKAKANKEPWLGRLMGIRANASCKSHEELDNSKELDRGDVDDWAKRLKNMRKECRLRVIGGCCGTDHEHIAALSQ